MHSCPHRPDKYRLSTPFFREKFFSGHFSFSREMEGIVLIPFYVPSVFFDQCTMQMHTDMHQSNTKKKQNMLPLYPTFATLSNHQIPFKKLPLMYVRSIQLYYLTLKKLWYCYYEKIAQHHFEQSREKCHSYENKHVSYCGSVEHVIVMHCYDFTLFVMM